MLYIIMLDRYIHYSCFFRAEIFAFSFTSAVIFAIGTMTGVLVALWLCRWQKCNNHQVLKEAEAEIIRLSMKVGNVLQQQYSARCGEKLADKCVRK